MSLLGPLLILAISVVPIGLGSFSENPKVAVQLPAELKQYMADSDLIDYILVSSEYSTREVLKDNDLLVRFNSDHWSLDLYYPSGTSPQQVRLVLQDLESLRIKIGLVREGLSTVEVGKATQNVSIQHMVVANSEKRRKEVMATAGLLGAILVYFFIFMYSGMVLKGVTEEKTNRIAEVLCTTTSPISLFVGKILGISWVALLQLMVWMLLSWGVGSTVYRTFKLDRYADDKIQKTLEVVPDRLQVLEIHQIVSYIEALQVPIYLSWLTLFFALGYIMYSMIFASIAANVSVSQDLSQMVFPVTLPLLISFAVVPEILEHPNSTISEVFSLFPLTAPVILALRIPLGLPMWKIGIYAFTLVSFLMVLGRYCSAMYRRGILNTHYE